jgi:hypothetical protein
MPQTVLSAPADTCTVEPVSPPNLPPTAPTGRSDAFAPLECGRPVSGSPGGGSHGAECSAASRVSCRQSSLHSSTRFNDGLVSPTTAFHGGRARAPRRRARRRKVWMTSAAAPVHRAKVGSDAIRLARSPVLLIPYIYRRRADVALPGSPNALCEWG